MSQESKRLLALPGSLRRRSYNRRLLDAAADIAPSGVIVHVYPHAELAAIPLFDEDLDEETGGGPEAVRRLRREVAAADGLLIATPEYNQSIPGVLKNTSTGSRAKRPPRSSPASPSPSSEPPPAAGAPAWPRASSAKSSPPPAHGHCQPRSCTPPAPRPFSTRKAGSATLRRAGSSPQCWRPLQNGSTWSGRRSAESNSPGPETAADGPALPRFGLDPCDLAEVVVAS